MANASAMPPMNKISMIGIWMESVLYGSNCIVYVLCVFVLLRGGKPGFGQWVLVLTSTILFILCTAHISASLRQLLEAFTYVPADVPDYSTRYWLDITPLTVLKQILYVTLIALQDVVLIWRLYIVFNRSWKVAIFPMIVEAAHLATAYAAQILLAINPDAGVYNPLVSHLGLAGWALDISFNISVTLAITARLWWMSRTLTLVNANCQMENRCLVTLYIIIESGGLFACATIITLGLFVNHSPVSMTGIDVGSQLAVLTPLMIMVRVGLGLTPGVQQRYVTNSGPTTMRAGAPRSNPHMQVLVARQIEDHMELESVSTDPRSLVKNVGV